MPLGEVATVTPLRVASLEESARTLVRPFTKFGRRTEVNGSRVFANIRHSTRACARDRIWSGYLHTLTISC